MNHKAKLSSFCPKQRHDDVSQVQTTLSLGFMTVCKFVVCSSSSAQ